MTQPFKANLENSYFESKKSPLPHTPEKASEEIYL